MGHRLSKIYTRTGDGGTTGLGDGTRVPKDSPRIEALGAVDELNSVIGLLLAEPLPAEVRQALIGVQHALFDLGGEVCIPGSSYLGAEQLPRVEALLDQFNAHLPPLKEFILPGGSRAAALCHVARTVCRRAERSMITLASQETLEPLAQVYLNRLSDLLFVLARVVNRADGRDDEQWRRQPEEPKAPHG